MSIRVRFAPSPTGALHIGGIRTALYNYLLAKKHGGTFVLRIEDTDQTRYVPGAEDYFVEALKWCGIAPTEGIGFGGGDYAPYRQSERKDLYKKYAQQLIETGNAYYAFDTPDELEAMREKLKNETNQSYSHASRGAMKNSLTLSAAEVSELIEKGTPYVIRLKVPDNQTVMLNDLIRGEVKFNTSDLDDKVLMKADGMPTYHLANIVDDYLMRITHVIRGEEWLPSAGHHVLIYQAFGWSEAMPQFAHLPLILKPDGKGKLSKRDGKKFGFPVFPLGWKGASEEDSFIGFREMGFEPQAVINFLALLGWNSGTDKEIFSLDELCESFSLEKINKSGARFDFDKAKWFNQQYIHAKSNEDLAAELHPLSIQRGYAVSEAFLAQFAGMMKERVVFLTDFFDKGYYFFEPIKEYDQANVAKRWKPELKEKMTALIPTILDLDFSDPLSMEQSVKHWINENGVKMGDVLPLLRIALAGTMQGPAVFEMASLLGKTEVEQRLKASFAAFDSFK